MFLIVGLGNPGAEYADTRHNVGFVAVDSIAHKYGFSSFKSKFDGLVAEGKIADEKCIILKPQTYMNLSGNSVVKAAFFYKILPENIVVIHDDLDLILGQIKTKTGGGAGGHNGLKSIDSHITPNYNRIRIGIGYPNEKHEEKVVAHVLGKISKSESDKIKYAIDIVTDTIDILIKNGVNAYSNKLGMLLKKQEL